MIPQIADLQYVHWFVGHSSCQGVMWHQYVCKYHLATLDANKVKQ